MLYFDRIDVSEGIDADKTNASKECNIYHQCYFLDKGFKFQLDVCNGCHDLLMMSMNLSNVAILDIQGVAHRSIINGIIKSEPIDLLNNVNPNEKSGTL